MSANDPSAASYGLHVSMSAICDAVPVLAVSSILSDIVTTATSYWRLVIGHGATQYYSINKYFWYTITVIALELNTFKVSSYTEKLKANTPK